MPVSTGAGTPPAEGPDGGDAQVGCLLASGSILVGDVLGLVVSIASGEPLPLLELGILAGAVGYGFGATGLVFLTESLGAVVPTLRARLKELAWPLMLVIPGVVALGTWLVALWFDVRDGGLVLAISIAIVLVIMVVGLVPVLEIVLRPAKRGGRPRR